MAKLTVYATIDRVSVFLPQRVHVLTCCRTNANDVHDKGCILSLARHEYQETQTIVIVQHPPRPYSLGWHL